MKYIVYLTTNIVNKKIYVGVHKTNTPEIFDGYIGDGLNRFKNPSLKNPKSPFEYAVKKYGWDSFVRATLLIFDTEKEALRLETQIVDKDFITRTDTYNVALGGGMPPNTGIKCFQYNLDGTFVKEWNSYTEVLETLHYDDSSISNAIKFKRASHNYYWDTEKVDKLDLSLYTNYLPSILIYSYDSDGNPITTFNSMSECAKKLNSSLAEVQRAIKLGRKVKGYFLSNILVGKYIKPNIPKLTGKVHQYDLNGTFIKTYNSVKEAELILEISLKDMNNSIKLGYQCKGYLWSRGEFPKEMEPYLTKKLPSKKIGQYTMNGELIQIFDTVREARKQFPNVSKVLKGQAKHCHGYTFKYIEES